MNDGMIKNLYKDQDQNFYNKGFNQFQVLQERLTKHAYEIYKRLYSFEVLVYKVTPTKNQRFYGSTAIDNLVTDKNNFIKTNLIIPVLPKSKLNVKATDPIRVLTDEKSLSPGDTVEINLFNRKLRYIVEPEINEWGYDFGIIYEYSLRGYIHNVNSTNKFD